MKPNHRSQYETLLGDDAKPNAKGAVALIMDTRDPCAVFVGWAPTCALGELLRLVSFGYPGQTAVVHLADGTPADRDRLRRKLEDAALPGSLGWYARTRFVDGVLLDYVAETMALAGSHAAHSSDAA